MEDSNSFRIIIIIFEYDELRFVYAMMIVFFLPYFIFYILYFILFSRDFIVTILKHLSADEIKPRYRWANFSAVEVL